MCQPLHSSVRSGRGQRNSVRRRGFRAPLHVLLALAAALLAAGPAGPARAGTPSPSDWRDLVVYQVITDRFFNGDATNDAVEGNYAPADGYRIHGGDFAGLTAKLDYLRNLGVDAVWISPVVLNANAEYHGYAARDFLAVAPHFGGLAGLRAFVRAAHARGIRVIADVVCNHMGTLIGSADAGWPAYRYPGTYALKWSNAAKRYAGVFDDLAKFHAHGDIGSWSDPSQVVGQLSGLNDLKTEDAAVQAALVAAAAFLVDSVDVDGFRVDTVKHVEMAFWSAWCPAVRMGALAAGKTHFLTFGEVFDGDDAKVGSYTGTVGGGSYKFDSMLHYPLYYTADGVFSFSAAPADLSARYANLGSYDASVRERLTTFLDNHDNARFLSAGKANQDESRLRAALGWMLTARGIPVVYYGTEQNFDGGGDPWCREDMWSGQWDYGPSLGDDFDEAHALFRWFRALADARRRHEALRRGATTELFAEAGGPGLYVFRRESGTDSVLVAVNTSNGPLTRTVATLWPAGTALADALEPALADTVGAAGALALRVPARGVRIWERPATRAAWLAGDDRLRVESVAPAHDHAVNDRWSPLRVVFDRDVDAATLAGAFHLAPAVAGTWQAQGREARFGPAEAWSAAQTYAWSFDTTLAGADGRRLAVPFESRFRTTSTTTGVTVASGHVVDRIARQDLSAPETLLPAPWIGPDVMLLADAGRDRLYTLTAGGDLGHFLGDARWGKPEGLARAADGSLAVADENGLFRCDARAMTALAVAAAPAIGTGALAAGGAAFADRLYLCDPAADRVVRTDAAGTALETFATGVRGGEGLAFGPGGAWGTDLYVADADLSSLGTGADGPGRIARVDPAGTVTTLVQDPLLLRASALAFDTGGRFGGDLFAADIVGERVLRVTPAGQVSVFASGFANLAGSGCLAFGPDGALYVADPGAGEPFSKPGGSVAQGQVLRIAPAVLSASAPPDAPVPSALAVPAPNPARGGAVLRFTLAVPGPVRLTVHDVTGRRVAVAAEGAMAAGAHEVRWPAVGPAGRPLGAGLYFLRLETAAGTWTRRLVLVR